jgi:V8-like Glu-specific endopeptidase
MVVTSARLAAEEWREDDAFEPLTYEKVIGLNNLLRIAWLSRGLELAAPVCRIVAPAGSGSGFLIANDLLLTNHHVLPDEQSAAASSAEFNYQVNWAGDLEPVRRYTLDSAHFRTSEALDYTMVRVKDSPGDLFGFVDLTKRGQPAVNDFVSIIQHPQGGTKQICFTDNKVSAVFGDLLQYSTDTEPGSSGSPVFNQAWEIVGLHHRGGGLAGPDGKKYFTNEGILVASVMRDAAAFLGISDGLYELAFADLRAELVGLIDATGTPADPDALAAELLRTRPRFSSVIEDWSKLNALPGDGAALTMAIAGAAIGGALRQWARSDGHESIRAAATTDPPPDPALVALVSPYSGSDALPSDVYAAVLAGLRADRAPVAAIAAAAGPEGLAAAARAFLRGVSAGAKAYDPAAPAPPDPPAAPAA